MKKYLEHNYFIYSFISTYRKTEISKKCKSENTLGKIVKPIELFARKQYIIYIVKGGF